ncbi:MAG: site-specific DNA-methyltransferase, partial [Candidatus Lokiarchaeota archaeon]|nr:site-specific DNA-methyltransferase [Candidatus Lokiarchaeota archaeon]
KITINSLSYYRMLGMPTLRWKDKEKYEHLISDIHNKAVSFQINEDFYDISLKTTSIDEDDIWKNMLIRGDNKMVMESLIKSSLEKVDLIYIDPPFATGGNFNYKIHIGEEGAKEDVESYSDKWKGGIDSYLNFLYERIILMKHLLSEKGSIFLHLDWHISHYVKIMLDEIFGEGNFRNEIIWVYPAASAQTRSFFIRSFDVILFYTKSDKYLFNDDPNIYMEYSDRVKNALKEDENGVFYYRGGSHNGKKLSQKVYVKQDGIFPRDFWHDIPYIRANTAEYQGFSTQKPERLLKRIILATTNKNDLVADFFCGSGTTLAVAEKLGRRWIGCDSTNHAIHMGRKRLLNINNSNDIFTWKKKYTQSLKPFKILSLEGIHDRGFLPDKFMEKGENIKLKNIFGTSKPKLSIEILQNEQKIVLELTNYSLPFMDQISSKIREKIKIFSDWIDYWAIDFSYSQNVFNVNWTSFRTPKMRKIEMRSKEHSYLKPGKYLIAIMVIDILGINTIHKFEIKVD